MGRYTTLLLLPVAARFHFSLAATWTVDLDYGSFVGNDLTTSAGVSLAQPLTAFYSVPYATAPRFDFATAPAQLNAVQNLTDYGPVCIQSLSNFPEDQQSEDCLTLSIFVPEGIEATDELPVVIWVPGGSFNGGGGRTLNLPSMVGNSPANSKFIGVSINYRLGALGFLPSNLTHDAGLLNIGFIDIYTSIEWVQSYISKFGGSPDKVTVFGESAGAHAVGYQLLHLNTDKPLFRAVIMDSGGPTARAYPTWTYPLYATQTSEFLDTTGCYQTNSTEVFDCLRAADVSVIRNASVSVFNEYNPSIRWPFQPVVDDNFIAQPATKSWEEGKFNRVPILTGSNTNEGNSFAPTNLNTDADFRAFFALLIPLANSTILDTIETLYPAPDVPGSPFANSTVSAQYNRVAAAYGDYAYIQAVQETATLASSWGVNVFKYHFDQANSANLVLHGSELSYVTRTDPSDPLATVMNAYYASFIVTGNPNTNVPSNYTQWPEYTGAAPNQLVFKGTNAAVEVDNFRRTQLEFWRSIPEVLSH